MFPLKTEASYLSELLEKVGVLSICNFPYLSNLPGMEASCETGSFTKSDLVTLLAGRSIINSHGCSDKSYKPPTKTDNGDKNDIYVSLIGDSLTHYGGDTGKETLWNTYLSNGQFKVTNLGAAGSTSSAWREHFDNCENQTTAQVNQRMQLPPRSIMMIGGNDFHVFKGILQPLWWAVPFRRNQVLNNIERIATHHHKGNNGCGDFDADGTAVAPESCIEGDKAFPTQCYQYSTQNQSRTCPDRNNDGVIDRSDWGRGRLFMLLGNLPAVSLDPTVIPVLNPIFRRFGFYEKPNDNMVENEGNILNAENTLKQLGGILLLYYESMIPFLTRNALISTVINYRDCGKLSPSKVCTDHTWVSRQMFKLQFWENVMAYKRGGIPYIHMYSFFQDPGSNSRGCWWCADKGLWMSGHDAVVFSLDDGIHINHVAGYGKWASVIIPAMEHLKMNEATRTDSIDPPGYEADHGPGCNDQCLIILCYVFKICK